MGQSFYILQDGQRAGPYFAEQLAAAGLTADTLVWAEGMSEWQLAGRIPALITATQSSWPTAESYQPEESIAVPISYHSPTTSRPAPAYSGIVAGASVLQVIGLLFILLGVALGVGIVYATIDTGFSLWGWLSALFSAVFSIGYGILFFFGSSIGLAIRDIARNSFKG